MDDTEKLVQMMIRCGLATGHGDAIDDLIFELEKQIKNTSHAFSDALKEIEQLRLANLDLQMWFDYVTTECDRLQAEVLGLREALADIANIVNPYEDGDTMQEIAREALKEKE